MFAAFAQYFVDAPLAASTASIFLNLMPQAWHIYHWPLPPISLCSASQLQQVGWAASLRSHFHISPEMFNGTEVWALDCSRFTSRMSLYIAAPLFPSSLTGLSVPAAENNRRVIRLLLNKVFAFQMKTNGHLSSF